MKKTIIIIIFCLITLAATISMTAIGKTTQTEGISTKAIENNTNQEKQVPDHLQQITFSKTLLETAEDLAKTPTAQRAYANLQK